MRPRGTNNVSLSTKSRAKSAQSQKGKKKEKNDNPQGRLVRLQPKVFSPITSRRFALTANQSSDASGNLLFFSTGCADIIGFLGTEWTNFAQEYSEFRVRSLGYWFAPATVNAVSSTGPYQGGMVAAPWAQIKPTGANSIFQSNELIKFSTLEEKEVVVKAPNGANFQLWTAYGTTVPIDRDFGLTFFSVGTLAASSKIYTVVYELWADFKLPY